MLVLDPRISGFLGLLAEVPLLKEHGVEQCALPAAPPGPPGLPPGPCRPTMDSTRQSVSKLCVQVRCSHGVRQHPAA